MPQIKKNITVAIHQPNFFPWLGYFDKIIKSDLFVLLDNVQIQKTGSNWTNHVKLIISDKPEWITIPVDRKYSGYVMIKDAKISTAEEKWRNKLLRTIDFNYRKHPFYKEVYPVIEELVNYKTNLVSSFNANIIIRLLELFDVKLTKKIVFASSLNVEGASNDLLINIVKTLNGTSYMCGGGAEEYQDDEKFRAASLKLIYQNFKHPIYNQYRQKEFVPGLSIVDVLMNCGVNGAHSILTGGGVDAK